MFYAVIYKLFILLRYDRHWSYQKASAKEKSISFPASAKLTILTTQTWGWH